MEFICCKDPEEAALRVSTWCQQASLQGARSIYLPAGQTPIPLYHHWEKTRPTYLDHWQLLQIDEVINGNKQGVFLRFFRKELPSWSHRIRGVGEGQAQADLAILGLGLNGHVGFHEPGLPAEFFSGCVPLTQESASTVGAQEGSWAVTYGTGAFAACKKVLLLVTGSRKAEILRRFWTEEGSFPALYLRDHPGLTVVADAQATAEIHRMANYSSKACSSNFGS